MRVLELQRAGLDGLALVDRPALTPGPGDIVVAIRAAALNYRDLAIARGDYPPGARLPLVLGGDGAGVVRAVGPGVDRVAPGDRVVASYVLDWQSGAPDTSVVQRRLGGPEDGALAEEMLVPAHALVRIPDEITDAEAASLPIAGVTAWRGLFEIARLRPGDTLVVQGTGGVSTFALQLAAEAGVRTIVVGRTPAKLVRAAALGAWQTISLREHPAWEARVFELTGGRGADAVVDVVGGNGLAQSGAALRIGGVLLVVGFLDAPLATIDIRPLLRRMIRIETMSVGSRADLEALLRAMVTTGVRPVIDAVVPLTEVRAAFEHLGRGDHVGKIVVAP